MSGYKQATVTISEQEYRRLHEADMQRKFGMPAHRKTKEKKQDHTAELVNTLQQMEARQQHLEQVLRNIDQDYHQIDAETMQYILMQNNGCYESLSAAIEQTASNTHEAISLLSQQFEENMQREREQHRQNISDLVHQLDAHEQTESRKEDAARQWLGRATLFADVIRDQFDHEKFAPGRISRIQRSLEFAQSNLAEGYFESCLQISQQNTIELSELHFELEQRTVQWQAEYEQTCQMAHQIAADVRSNHFISTLDLNGEELPEKIDLDLWTNGQYCTLLDQCHLLLQNLAQDKDTIAREDITQVQAHILPAIQKAFESLIYEARLRALNSHLRMNIAEAAQQALVNRGYRLSEAGYEGRDMRAEYLANLERDDGNQVTIKVLPREDTAQELTNDLVVITKHPYIKTDQEARLQWEELQQLLHQFNLNIRRPDSSPAASSTAIADPQPVTRQKEETILQKRFKYVR
jgi:hypothetical protein